MARGDCGGKIRVLIADDHPMVREGLRVFLSLHDQLEVAGEAATGAEAVALAGKVGVDVVLMDLAMPDMDGIQATREIKHLHPKVKVVVLTSFLQTAKVVEAVRAGAVGFLMKDVRPDRLAEAIIGACRGEPQLDPEVSKIVLRELARTGGTGEAGPDGSGATTRDGDRAAGLTRRELEVLRLIASGLQNRDIAGRLYLSEKTVKTHVSNILQKLDVDDRTQAALYAVREGLVETR
jgi:DNA-binding NarL/FixJ family response regulator